MPVFISTSYATSLLWCSVTCTYLLFSFCSISATTQSQQSLPQCGSESYDPDFYTCFYDDVLCPTGLAVCGTVCYDSSLYSCASNAHLDPLVQPSPSPAQQPIQSIVGEESSDNQYPIHWFGNSFFQNFIFEDENDPTDGFVDYIDWTSASEQGLVSVTNNNQVLIKADAASIVPTGGRGRKSIRLESKTMFNGGLFIIDLQHVPTGCGTWPSFWMYGPDWPNSGEFDIIEGVHNDNFNSVTGHTSLGCDLTRTNLIQKGRVITRNCGKNPMGCQSRITQPNSFGSSFNANGGGVYATLWDLDLGFKTWFFSRTKDIPSDILNNTPNPSLWGVPDVHLPFGKFCPGSHFSNHSLTFDLTFCGEWAGDVWGSTPSCSHLASNCINFVRNNPAAFSEAYWLINYVKIFPIN